jgi:hypothetical protein
MLHRATPTIERQWRIALMWRIVFIVFIALMWRIWRIARTTAQAAEGERW